MDDEEAPAQHISPLVLSKMDVKEDTAQWSMPICLHTEQNITSWNTKSFSPNYRPPKFEHYQNPNPPNLIKPLMKLSGEEFDEEEKKYTDEELKKHEIARSVLAEHENSIYDAKKLQRPTDDKDLEPWLWTCRIYARVPENRYVVDGKVTLRARSKKITKPPLSGYLQLLTWCATCMRKIRTPNGSSLPLTTLSMSFHGHVTGMDSSQTRRSPA